MQQACRPPRLRDGGQAAPTTAIAPRGPEPRPKEPLGDDWNALIDKLHDGRTCKERRTAALALIAADDQRFLEVLRGARERRSGGFAGLFNATANGCMKKELDAAIRHLELK